MDSIPIIEQIGTAAWYRGTIVSLKKPKRGDPGNVSIGGGKLGVERSDIPRSSDRRQKNNGVSARSPAKRRKEPTPRRPETRGRAEPPRFVSGTNESSENKPERSISGDRISRYENYDGKSR